jgi:hypothetical protein
MDIKIRQIFQNHDLRAGMDSLSAFLKQRKKSLDRLGRYEVYLFMNRERNLIKVIAQQGLFQDRLPSGQTFDFTLRRNQILTGIGEYFGIDLKTPMLVYQKAQKVQIAEQARQRAKRQQQKVRHLREARQQAATG